MDIRSRRVMRDSSPERTTVCPRPRVNPIKKVQVIYYLSRNGHLEHPHYIEVTHLADRSLRLKDVMERLTILRGKGMPSLYSWSCKRSYRNGYVWNDLAANDTIYPSEGAEYVLKGSELVEGCSARSSLQEASEKRTSTRHKQNIIKYEEQPREYDEDEEELDYELLDEEKTTSYSTSSTTPRSNRCSNKGTALCTDETDQQQQVQLPEEKITTANPEKNDNKYSIVVSDAVGPATASRGSVLLQLIACGSSVARKAIPAAARDVGAMRNVPRGILCNDKSNSSTDEEMIKYISENPRFGNVQAEEKEYFSGSIVEAMKTEERAVPSSRLQRSNSYNEERNGKAKMEETVVEEKREKTKTTGKCIPRRRSTTSNESKK